MFIVFTLRCLARYQVTQEGRNCSQYSFIVIQLFVIQSSGKCASMFGVSWQLAVNQAMQLMQNASWP